MNERPREIEIHIFCLFKMRISPSCRPRCPVHCILYIMHNMKISQSAGVHCGHLSGQLWPLCYDETRVCQCMLDLTKCWTVGRMVDVSKYSQADMWQPGHPSLTQEMTSPRVISSCQKCWKLLGFILTLITVSCNCRTVKCSTIGWIRWIQFSKLL